MRLQHAACSRRGRPISRVAGFTLVEIMTVVAIIGLLAAIAVPNMMRSQTAAQAGRYAHDVRVAMDSFMEFALMNGQYPADTTPGIVPPGMEEFLRPLHWTAPTSLGGEWDWDRGVFGVNAGVSVFGPTASMAALEMVDAQLDDGDLTSGAFRERAGGFVAIIEP